MPVPYIFVTQQAPPGSSREGEPITLARTKVRNRLDTDDLCKMISARCTLNGADVKAVFAILSELFSQELPDGAALQLDGIGTFSLTANTGALAEPEKVRQGDFHNLRIRFSPDRRLKKIYNTVTFQKMR
ncbi:hypothetical protein AB2B38_012475 [Balneola sp. MJW-20]|uniref:HU family DNA-binding protein n=1 Tax=Gracilimonas aurantiaca TaxID=3234185 RepID=UPI0034655BF1